MSYRAVRVTLVLLAIAAIGAAAYGVLERERATAVLRSDLARVERDARDLQVLGSDIRAAQQSYVAAGQGDAFWKDRVTTLAARLEGELSDFEQMAESDAARTAIADAQQALDRFRKVDARARDYLASGQHLLASDAIFADGIEAMASLSNRIETARVAEIGSRDVRVNAVRQSEIGFLGAAAAISIMTLLLLAPLPRPADRAASDDGAADEAARHETQDLYIKAPPARARVESPRVEVDLETAAGLCTALARVAENGELSPLLERAAGLLGASGLVLWLADSEGTLLRPVLAHGYGAEVVMRLGAIPRDADNAAAAAFRTVQTQTVPRNGTAHGAIVAPLLATAGCVGVLAVETGNGNENLASIRALTMIFAAQLSAMLGTEPPAAVVPPAEPQAQAQA